MKRARQGAGSLLSSASIGRGEVMRLPSNQKAQDA